VVVKRNPDRTRQRILEAAFAEIYRNGFRSASVDQILSDTGLTKGALYHHFPNKAALGYAVVEEIIGGHINQTWIQPLADSGDPITALMTQLRSMTKEQIAQVCDCGCPLNNLAQEMSSVDDEFRKRIAAVFAMWREGIAESLERGRTTGTVRPDADCRQAASFFVAGVEGATGLAKNARDPEVLSSCIGAMSVYLESLRP